jgi:hypothetical protein
MLQEILDLGFENVELGHGIRLSLMEGIQRFYDAGKVRFSTLHNFCPLPVEITRPAPDCYQFSSHRDTERERAVKLTFQTIDFAKRLGAPLVVMHLGRVPIDHFTDKLVAMAEAGEHLSRKYVNLKLKAVHEREKAAPLYLQRAKECLLRGGLRVESRDQAGSGRPAVLRGNPTEMELTALLDEINAPEVVGTGMTSGISRSRKTSALWITRSGWRTSRRGCWAGTCMTRNGRGTTTCRLSRATSITTSWSR